ncbi:MAG: glycosyltransferase family 4 protein [Deltaproteobacteria bacterium]|nr:glycosyltransferase family 4 protein [Deltaproteobacteria bacterium]
MAQGLRKTMNLYVLMHRSFAPRYRIPQFIPFLRARGIETDLVRLPAGLVGRWSRFTRADRYDAVLLERRLIQPWELGLLRRRSRRLVFDFDDAIMYRSSRWGKPESGSRMGKFRRIVESCDMVFAGNSFLREVAMRFTTGDRVFVIPTVVDLSRYAVREYGESAGEVTIGWIGSSGTIQYLQGILPALEEVARKKPRVSLKIVCDRFLDSPSIRIVKKSWAEDQEVGDLQSFDIGIMPLTDDPWAQGKCGLKIVQYLAVGVPVVCSPVGMNRDIVRDGSNGFWAKTNREWVEKLCTLAEDPGLREKMGLEGRRIVEGGYSLQAVGERLVRLLDGLVKDKSHPGPIPRG